MRAHCHTCANKARRARGGTRRPARRVRRFARQVQRGQCCQRHSLQRRSSLATGAGSCAPVTSYRRTSSRVGRSVYIQLLTTCLPVQSCSSTACSVSGVGRHGAGGVLTELWPAAWPAARRWQAWCERCARARDAVLCYSTGQYLLVQLWAAGLHYTTLCGSVCAWEPCDSLLASKPLKKRNRVA